MFRIFFVYFPECYTTREADLFPRRLRRFGPIRLRCILAALLGSRKRSVLVRPSRILKRHEGGACAGLVGGAFGGFFLGFPVSFRFQGHGFLSLFGSSIFWLPYFGFAARGGALPRGQHLGSGCRVRRGGPVAPRPFQLLVFRGFQVYLFSGCCDLYLLDLGLAAGREGFGLLAEKLPEP